MDDGGKELLPRVTVILEGVRIVILESGRCRAEVSRRRELASNRDVC